MTKDRIDLICLGEPMVEFNEQPDGRWLCGFGGDVSNVAIAAARQGVRSAMATRVGADSFGDDLMGLWLAEGVDTAAVARVEDAPTGIYFVRHGPDGHGFEYRRKGSAASMISPETLPVAAIRGASMLHFSGISLAISESSAAACTAAMAEARQAGQQIACDTNLRLNLWSLGEARAAIHGAMAGVDIALPGLDDAGHLTGLSDPSEIAAFYHRLGPRIVALTLGAGGALVSVEGKETIVAAPQVRAVDASGAGDCFDGAFLARIIAGDTPVEAARYAVTAAALSVQGYGAVAPIPTRAAVMAALG